MARLLVDCDPGHDDAVALAVAAHFGELVGITTVGGNAPLADVTTNALLTCQLFGLDVEVHAGAVRPLVAAPRHAPEIHGVDGFDGPTLPTLERRPASADAVDYLIETIRGEEGLWLVPTGPLTNVAIAMRQAPDLAERLAGISFMGGSAGPGNRTPAAEFNLLVDPEAAAAVLSSGARIHMAGLDLTHQFTVDDALAADLRALGGPGAVLLADLVDGYLDNAEQITGRRWGGLHDPCAVLAVTHPEVIESELRRVDVELAGTFTRGMTVVDLRAGDRRSSEPPNVYHGHTLDHPTARRLVLEAVAALDGEPAT
ncbi:MAG: nucleoside hydrolase [Actinomycetota bacterium]